jgi:hypothetical protein
MAVTQQLARVSGEYLDRCRTLAAASPDADPEWNPPADDRIDLDWAPSFLIDACKLAGVDTCTLEALMRALDGAPDIDVSVLHHPEATGSFGPCPTALGPDSVARLAAKLTELDWEKTLAAIPENRRGTIAGDRFTGNPPAYLTNHFTTLRDFYVGAAQRGLFVVLWWD